MKKEMERFKVLINSKKPCIDQKILHDTLKKNFEESQNLVRELEEKVYVLENENNLLKLNNEFQRKALHEMDEQNLMRNSSVKFSKKHSEQLIELKEKVDRLQLIKAEQEGKNSIFVDFLIVIFRTN